VSQCFSVLLWSYILSYFMYIACEAPVAHLDRIMFAPNRRKQDDDCGKAQESFHVKDNGVINCIYKEYCIEGNGKYRTQSSLAMVFDEFVLLLRYLTKWNVLLAYASSGMWIRRPRVRLGYCATEAHSWARGGASASAAAMTSLLWNAQTGEAGAAAAERATAAAPARQLCAV
ncbi:hypothetical protein HPB47_020453, partial [Ixodes persulcatus]